MELDIDAILAIVLTGYLTMLPLHCWSSGIKSSRIRHLLVGLWNMLMLAGSICALILWPRLYDTPFQYRFCYPEYPDPETLNNDGWVDGLWKGTWNATIWHLFQDVNTAFDLSDNCLYPCFNTSQVLRRQNSMIATLNTNVSPRTNGAITEKEETRILTLVFLMYLAIVISTCVAVTLLILTVTGLRRFTRVPVHSPLLLWSGRKELAHAFLTDIRSGAERTVNIISSPNTAVKAALHAETLTQHLLHFLRFWTDALALLLLLTAMFLVPTTLATFLVWIEWYINHDLVSQEAPSQVGQWTTSVSIAFVLVSAGVLRLRYWVASEEEVREEVLELKERLRKLEQLGERKGWGGRQVGG